MATEDVYEYEDCSFIIEWTSTATTLEDVKTSKWTEAAQTTEVRFNELEDARLFYRELPEESAPKMWIELDEETRVLVQQKQE